MTRFIPFAIPSGTSPAVQTQTKSATIATNGGSVTVEPDSGFLLSAATVTAEIPTQTKSATITANGGSVTVEPDSGFLLSAATVTADIPTQEKTLTVTENGTYTINPSAGKLMKKATVTVNVPTGGGLPAWIKEQSVTTFIPSSDTTEPLTVALTGMSGVPGIVIVLTSLRVPTVGATYGGGVFANSPNEIAKTSSSENMFFGPHFYRQFSGNGYVHSFSSSSSGVTNFSSASITVTPPTYSSSVCKWLAGVTYTIIALQTKTP